MARMTKAAAAKAAAAQAAAQDAAKAAVEAAAKAAAKVNAKAAKIAAKLELTAEEREVIDAARAGWASDRNALARDVAALQAAAKDGRACKTYADLYKAAIVAEILGYSSDDIGIIRAQALMQKGAKRDKKEQLAILAANARLSRRVKAAGLEAANTSGKKRKPRTTDGTTDGTTTTTNGTTDGTTTEKPALPPVMQPRILRAPILANEVEWVDHLAGLAAYLRAAQSKNAKAATARVRHAIAACTKAVAELEKAVAPKA